MTEQEMRRRMHQAMDARLSGLQEDPWLAQRVMNQPKGEKKVKRFTIQTVLAMMLLLAIMGTVYAASLNSAPDDLITNTPVPASEGMGEVDQWALVKMLEQESEENPCDINGYLQFYSNDFTYSDMMSVPSFDTGFDQELELEYDGFRFRLRDAYISGNTLYTITEISRVNGERAMIVEMPADKEQLKNRLYRGLYLRGLNRDIEITAQEYIEKYNVPVYIASAGVEQVYNSNTAGSSASRREGDGKLIVYETINHVWPRNDGTVHLEWSGMVWDDKIQDYRKVTMPLVLEMKPVEEKEISVCRLFKTDGFMIELESITLRKTDIDVQVDFHCRLIEPTIEKGQLVQKYSFYAVDPGTENWRYLKMGSKMHGGMATPVDLNTGEFNYERTTLSLEAWDRDSLIIQFLPFDVWGHGDPQQPLVDVKIK